MTVPHQQQNQLPSLPLAAELLVPHRAPMLLIERLTARDGDFSSATAIMPAAGIFFDDQDGIEEIIVEIIAQAMAAAEGYKVLIGEQPPKDGMLAGIDFFSLHHVPKPGARLEVEVEVEMSFGTISVGLGKVFCDGVLQAEGRLKVWASEKK